MQFPYFIDTIVPVVKDKKHSLLTLFIICLDVHVTNNNKCSLLNVHICHGTVIHVMENNNLSLLCSIVDWLGFSCCQE